MDFVLVWQDPAEIIASIHVAACVEPKIGQTTIVFLLIILCCPSRVRKDDLSWGILGLSWFIILFDIFSLFRNNLWFFQSLIIVHHDEELR